MSQQAAQYPVPPSWRKTSFDITPETQQRQARAALEKNVQSTNTAALHPILAYQMIEFDRLSNASSQYNSTVFNILTSLEDENPGFSDQYLIPHSSGYAATKAFMVYGGPNYLDLAREAWQTANRYTISPSQAQMGSIPSKNFTLESSCGGASMAGGTFWITDQGDARLDVHSSGWFLMVSGLLANATGNSTYLDAASLSFQFLFTQLYNHTTNEVMESIDANTCQANPVGTIGRTAVFLEGATILGKGTGNETTAAFAHNLVQNTIKNVSSSNPQGILEENSLLTVAEDENGGHLIRSLKVAYDANATDKGLRDYIRTFIAVQYNALVDLASDADIYAGSWTGPTAEYNFYNQTAAIDVLLAGLAVTNATDSGSASPPVASMSPGSPTPSHHKSNVGAIVGGVIGGSILLFIILVLLMLILRQRRRIAEAATLPKSFEGPFQDSIQESAHGQDDQQSRRGKRPIPPPTSGSSIPPVPQSDGTLEETHSLDEGHEETQGITIGSLIWELNELLRRNNRTVREELPAYSASHTDA